MHVFHEFPKWKYHAEKEAVIVPHKEAEEALGEGWHDSPAHVVKREAKAPKPEPMPMDEPRRPFQSKFPVGRGK